MLAVLFNNLSDILLGLVWTYTAVWCGMRLERWRNSKGYFSKRKQGAN